MDNDRIKYNIKSMADLRSIDGYQYDVDPHKNPLVKVLDWYEVPTSSMVCGLSNCHTNHQHGYLVELQDGSKTNVGHICGASAYENFNDARKVFADKVLRPTALRAIRECKIYLHSLLPKLRRLENDASDLIVQRDTFRELYPTISKELQRRSYDTSSTVNETVARSNKAIDDLMAANPYQNRESLRFEEVKKGTLTGLKLFNYDFRNMISENLVRKAIELDSLEVSLNVRTDALLKWEFWIKNVDDAFKQAADAINESKLFFSASNYNLMSLLPGSKTETTKLKALKTSSFKEPKSHPVAQTKISKGKKNRKLGRLNYFASLK